jgi:hypothetical protein
LLDDNKSFFCGALERASNSNRNKLMAAGGLKGILSTLVNCKHNIGACVPTQVQKHTNDSIIIEDTRGRGPSSMLRMRGSLDRGTDSCKELGAEPKSLSTALC